MNWFLLFLDGKNTPRSIQTHQYTTTEELGGSTAQLVEAGEFSCSDNTRNEYKYSLWSELFVEQLHLIGN